MWPAWLFYQDCRSCGQCDYVLSLLPTPPLQVSGERDFFAKVVVDAVTKLDPETLDLRMLGIKKVQVSKQTLNPQRQLVGAVGAAHQVL